MKDLRIPCSILFPLFREGNKPGNWVSSTEKQTYNHLSYRKQPNNRFSQYPHSFRDRLEKL